MVLPPARLDQRPMQAPASTQRHAQVPQAPLPPGLRDVERAIPLPQIDATHSRASATASGTSPARANSRLHPHERIADVGPRHDAAQASGLPVPVRLTACEVRIAGGCTRRITRRERGSLFGGLGGALCSHAPYADTSGEFNLSVPRVLSQLSQLRLCRVTPGVSPRLLDSLTHTRVRTHPLVNRHHPLRAVASVLPRDTNRWPDVQLVDKPHEPITTGALPPKIVPAPVDPGADPVNRLETSLETMKRGDNILHAAPSRHARHCAMCSAISDSKSASSNKATKPWSSCWKTRWMRSCFCARCRASN